MTGEWIDPFVRGVTALLVCGATYVAARYRFKRWGSNGDQTADIGLD